MKRILIFKKNHNLYITQDVNLSMKVRIFDTTLRDGEQTPGISFTPENKLSIAEKLDDLGVDVIEAGFPIISSGEMKGVKLITSAGLSCEVAGLARTIRKDIDAAVDAGLSYIHTFIATSDMHLKYKLKMTQEQVLEKAIDAVEYAKSLGLQVEFSAEDATRTDKSFLKKVFNSVSKAGVDRIDIPDTVGYATPDYMAEITRDAIKTGLPVSVHCHNDFGLAVSNAISGIKAGASCAHVTINGIGERAGNASLEELTMALKCLEFDDKYETNINSKLIYKTSRYVSKIAGMQVQPNKAIVGDNAFGHESGIHTHGILSNPLTYEPISPELVGQKRRLQVGKHAGIHGMNAVLSEYGIKPDEEQSKMMLESVKKLGDLGKTVTDVELLSIATDILGNEGIKQIVKLVGFSVSTGIGIVPHASVKINIDEETFISTSHGNGPVDAAFRAILKIGKISEISLENYNLDGISGGSSASCQATIIVKDKTYTAFSKAVGEDIVTTSVNAFIDGINKIMLKKKSK